MSKKLSEIAQQIPTETTVTFVMSRTADEELHMNGVILQQELKAKGVAASIAYEDPKTGIVVVLNEKLLSLGKVQWIDYRNKVDFVVDILT